MESRFSRQMKKGVLEMLVLGLVCEQPGHGYELLNRLAVRSGGFLHTREGTLYPILYRLEDDGFISSSWQTGGTARTAPKKYIRQRQRAAAPWRPCRRNGAHCVNVCRPAGLC